MTTEELDAIEKIINEGEASIQRAPNGTLITDPLVVAWFGGMRALVAEVRRLSGILSAHDRDADSLRRHVPGFVDVGPTRERK